MSTEKPPSKPRTRAEHAQKFAQCCRNLRTVADNLARIDPEFFTRTDVAKSLLSVALSILTETAGDGGAVDYLRSVANELADCLEAGEQRPN
jgi:hypothetical protein